LPEFRGRFTQLPRDVRQALVVIAKSSLADQIDADHHEMLLQHLISMVDAKFGEDVRVEMGWCLEKIDDHPIAEWVAGQDRHTTT